jgi:hypothetical protein
MSGSAGSSAATAGAGTNAANPSSGQQGPIRLTAAGVAGMVLLLASAGACLVMFYHPGGASAGTTGVPVGIAVLAGIVLLLVSLAGLVLLFRALGLADSSAAFGLPAGSIRALLALGLVVVFVAVAAEVMHDPNAGDLTKQVLTISATALATVIGFYFGSNAANEAASKMADTLTSQAGGTSADTTPPPAASPDQVAQKVTAIRSLATGAKAALDNLGDPSFDTLKAAVAAAASRLPAGSPGIDAAQAPYDILTKSLAALTTDADRAEAALKAWRDAGSDASKLPPAASLIDQRNADAASANHAFAAALDQYKSQRDALLKSIAPA